MVRLDPFIRALRRAMVGTTVAAVWASWISVHAAESCNVAADMEQFSQVLSESTGGGTAQVGSCQAAVQPSAVQTARVECPVFLKSAYLNSDRHRGFLDESASESCRVQLRRAEATSPGDIERRLSKHPASRLGIAEGFFENCLAQQPLSESEKKSLTAEYYLGMNRLRLGSQSSLEMIAAIDSTLGRKPLADRNCSGSRLPEIDFACRKLQSCQPSNSLGSQAAELEQVWPMIQELEKRHRNEEESKQLQLLRSMYPAIGGKEFRNRFDPGKRNFREALAQQLQASRSRVLQQLESYRKGMDCLNGRFSCSAECEEFPHALAQAPEFRVEEFRIGDRPSSDEIDVQAYLGAAECRMAIRHAKREASEVVTDFAVGAGLTIATAGLGSVAAGAKAASTVVSAGRAASAGSRVANLATKAGLARAAMLGGDLYFAASGVNAAIDQCADVLNQLSTASSDWGSITCPGGDESKQVQVMADYRACVLSSLLNVAPNLLPFAPAFVKTYQSSARKLAAAKPSLEHAPSIPSASVAESAESPGLLKAAVSHDETAHVGNDAVPQIRRYALVRSADSKLASQATRELGGVQVDRVLKERLAIIDGDKLKSGQGQVTIEEAIAKAHSNPLQLQLNQVPGGKMNSFVLAIPPGRENRGLIDEKLREAIIQASQSKDPHFNPQSVVLRDSGLLFSSAGIPLSKQEISALVIRSVGEDLRPVAKPAVVPEVAPVIPRVEPRVPAPQAPSRRTPASSPSWFPSSHSAEKLATRPTQPLDGKSVLLKALDRTGCSDCPEAVRVGSAMSHARVHFWEHKPPKVGESAEQWMARRVAEDGRAHVTSIFPPGITQNQIIARAQAAKLKAVPQGSDAVIRGKLALQYVDASSRAREGLFEVKIVVCRQFCEPNLPGDVISIFPINGPGVIKYEPRSGKLVH